MAWKQLIKPNLSITDGAGWCLRFARRVYNVPAWKPSAWEQWLVTARKHRNRNLPKNAAVPVWFSHWGTYGGVYGNWGHVVIWVPGRGYLSSPTSGHGQRWLNNIGAVERAYNSKFVGWTEDIGGVRVVAPAPAPKKGLTVKHYQRADKHSKIGKGRTLRAGDHIYLNTVNGRAASATNIVGGVGPYSITPHVYAEGEPGDAVLLTLVWQNTRSNPRKNSSHYVERLVFDKEGRIQASREFKRAVASGYAVYARVQAAPTNNGLCRITRLDSDAYLIK